MRPIFLSLPHRTSANRQLIAMAIGAALAWPIAALAAAPAPERMLQEAVAGPWRSEQNRERDDSRHPAQTLTFFHVRPDVALIEITPGTGWYSEILAPLLRERGSYTAANMIPDTAPAAYRDYVKKANDTLAAKFAATPALYSAAKTIEFDPAAPVFGAPASADVVVTFRNVHNWTKAGTDAVYFRGFFAVLKPGGVLGVEDHRANPGTPLNVDSGYLTEAYVIKLATDAGFKLDARSEINANPKDTKDYPKGVWTLPPTLRLGETDREKYLAIGESDRFTLRFIKPLKP